MGSALIRDGRALQPGRRWRDALRNLTSSCESMSSLPSSTSPRPPHLCFAFSAPGGAQKGR